MSLIVTLQELQNINQYGAKESQPKLSPLIVKLEKTQTKYEDCKHMSVQEVIDYINKIN